VPRFINTVGDSVLSVAKCDRCGMKRKYVELVSDHNVPGLRVCVYGCVDQFDPWRLPAPAPENITLEHARPDVALDPDPLLVDEDGGVIVWTGGDWP
jgi:hypothetical protein